MAYTGLLASWCCVDDVGIARVDDTQAADSEVFTTRSSQINIVSMVVVDSDLRQHSIVLNLRLAERRAVVSKDHKLCLGVPEGPEDGLVAERVLAALHDKLQLVVDVVPGLLRLLRGGHHGCAPRRSGGGARVGGVGGGFFSGDRKSVV